MDNLFVYTFVGLLRVKFFHPELHTHSSHTHSLTLLLNDLCHNFEYKGGLFWPFVEFSELCRLI